MKKIFLLGVFIIFLASCSWMDSSNVLGLKRYFLSFIRPYNIKIEELSCKMSPPGYRTGYFLFKIGKEEFLRLKDVLHLKEMEIYEGVGDDKYIRPHIITIIKRASLVKGFIFKNPQFILEEPISWNREPLLPEVFIYVAEPPLPPMKGNTKTSFNFLIYNFSTQIACAFLEYPYG